MTGTQPKALAHLARLAERREGSINAIVHGQRGIHAANDLTEEQRRVALQQHAQAFKSTLNSKGAMEATIQDPDSAFAKAHRAGLAALKERAAETAADKAARANGKAAAAQPTSSDRAAAQAPILSGPPVSLLEVAKMIEATPS